MDVPQVHPQGADPRAFLESIEPQIFKKLEEDLEALGGGLKFQLALKVDLVKVNSDGSEEYTDPVLRHKQEAVLQKSEIKAALQQAFPRLLETLEKWTHRGSGWAVVQVHTLWLDIARYQPLRGGSYIPLPPALKNKKAVVNVKNMDDHCLRWALRSALFQAAKDPHRPTKYPAADGLDFTGVDAPTPISQIASVERQNNLAINLFGWDKGVIVHHLSKQSEEEARINLLLIEKAGKFHYTWIKDLNRLLYDQSKHRERKHFCERCLHGYSREDLLEDHKSECQGIGQAAVRVEMPPQGKNKLTFQNHHKQLTAPYIIYADFEALTTKVEGPELDPTKSNTQRTQHHEACSYCYVKVRCDGQTEAPVEYRGPNAVEHFLRALQEEERGIKKALANPQTMRMTSADWETHRTARRCHVCDGLLEGGSVKDHYHITGKYRGAAHSACNLYCRTDVLLLADVFENFRKTSQKQYGLDPAHYYTSPGLSWDALLKKTGVSLELLTDYDQHLFIEKGMRGDISIVSKRHARANNPAVEGYDPEKPNSHILYLDANNLYGWAMSQPLPTGGFRWVEDCDGLAGTIKDQPADGPEGFILEVDLEYPQELHDEHNAYPLAPERMVVQKEWMSEYQHGLLGAARGGVRRGRKTGPQPPRQELLRAPLPQPPALLGTRDEIEKDKPRPALRAEPLDGALHSNEHRAAKAGHQRL